MTYFITLLLGQLQISQNLSSFLILKGNLASRSFYQTISEQTGILFKKYSDEQKSVYMRGLYFVLPNLLLQNKFFFIMLQ